MTWARCSVQQQTSQRSSPVPQQDRDPVARVSWGRARPSPLCGKNPLTIRQMAPAITVRASELGHHRLLPEEHAGRRKVRIEVTLLAGERQFTVEIAGGRESTGTSGTRLQSASRAQVAGGGGAAGGEGGGFQQQQARLGRRLDRAPHRVKLTVNGSYRPQ
jgi:hypothetical protein